MIKECKVKLNNSAVTVVSFGNVEVQFPAINKDLKTVFVEYNNGKYSIVDNAVNQSKKAKKRKTVEEDNTNGLSSYFFTSENNT